jgi:hypothetical protein
MKGETMTVTKEQLVAMNGWGELHYTGKHECTRTIGPRGGVTENITHVRLSGQCQTWKRDTTRFRQPVKYGLYESSAIEPRNADDFHKACDCPLNDNSYVEQSDDPMVQRFVKA